MALTAEQKRDLKARRPSPSQRKQARREQTMAEIRRRLRADWYITEIHEVLKLCAEDNPNKPSTPAALGRAKLRLDAASKILAKVLPDLRAVALADLREDQSADAQGLLQAIARAAGNSPLDHIQGRVLEHRVGGEEEDGQGWAAQAGVTRLESDIERTIAVQGTHKE